MNYPAEAMSSEIHALAISRGWWEGPDDERVERLLDWIIEEVEEARVAYRTRRTVAWTSIDAEGKEKPEGFAAELSDIWLILHDLAEGTAIDFPPAIRTKLDYAKVRKYRRDKNGATA